MSKPRLSLPRGSIASIKSKIQNVARFRWLIFVIGNFANFANSVVGSSLSLTIVAMIEKDELQPSSTSFIENNGTLGVIIEPITSQSSGKIHVDWTNVDKDRMLQAGFWGILTISAFGGRICELFGPRRVVALSLLIIGLVNMLFPMIASRTFYGAYFAKIIQGMCSGLVQPATFVIVSRWSTSYERTLSNSVVTCGGAFGNLVSLPFAGILVSSTFLGGWPSVFYLFGALNLVVAVIWYLIIYDNPEEHPYLSPEELEEILNNRSLKSGDAIQVPWTEMLTSSAVIAHLAPTFTYGWVVAVVSSQIPSFYEEVLDFSHTANGFMAALPWLVSTLCALIGGTIADKVRRTNRFSLSSIRKTITAIGLGTVSCGLLAITFLGKKRMAIVLTLSISKGMGALSVAGSGANHLDIAPSFAGTLAGFGAMLSSLASLAANEGVARIVGNEPTAQKWYRFFYISTAVNLAGVIIFCLLGSGEVQDWDPSSIRKQSLKSQFSDRSRSRSEIHHSPKNENPESPEINTIGNINQHVIISTIHLEPKD